MKRLAARSKALNAANCSIDSWKAYSANQGGVAEDHIDIINYLTIATNNCALGESSPMVSQGEPKPARGCLNKSQQYPKDMERKTEDGV